jgi:hypothetical protein
MLSVEGQAAPLLTCCTCAEGRAPYFRADIPLRCRLDRLTAAWFADRLLAKLAR